MNTLRVWIVHETKHNTARAWEGGPEDSNSFFFWSYLFNFSLFYLFLSWVFFKTDIVIHWICVCFWLFDWVWDLFFLSFLGFFGFWFVMPPHSWPSHHTRNAYKWCAMSNGVVLWESYLLFFLFFKVSKTQPGHNHWTIINKMARTWLSTSDPRNCAWLEGKSLTSWGLAFFVCLFVVIKPENPYLVPRLPVGGT